jgi:hypothetical protein
MSYNDKPSYIPEFATTDYTDPGGRVNITEPTTDEKEKGWQYLQKPGSNKMNWIHRGNYYWINYFNQFWNSSHQFLINEITSESGNGINVLQPLGIKTIPVSGTNLHVHQADSAASVSRFTNSATTSAASHGTEYGIDASEQSRIWNYENTDIVIGTNNLERLYIKNNGHIWSENSPDGVMAEHDFSIVGYNIGPVLHGRLSAGTKASPTSPGSGALLFGLGARPYATSDWTEHSTAGIHFISTENISSTNQGTKIQFPITPTGTTWSSRKVALELIDESASLGVRYRSDFSNATHALRTMFQTITTDGATSIFAIPNGTSTTASFIVANSSDAGNCSYGQIAAYSTGIKIVSGKLGTGTYLPLYLNVSGADKIGVSSSGLDIMYDADSYWRFNVGSTSVLTMVAAEATGYMMICPGTTNPIVQLYSAGANAILRMTDSDISGYGDISHNGTNLVIGTAGASAGNIVITNTTECTGADTGSFQVDGGMHVAGNNWIGGYYRSEKGRWPTGNYAVNSPTHNNIFDALSSYIPNTNDDILIHGGCALIGGAYCMFSHAVRTSSTRITLYAIAATAQTGLSIDDGSSTVSMEYISIAW